MYVKSVFLMWLTSQSLAKLTVASSSGALSGASFPMNSSCLALCSAAGQPAIYNIVVVAKFCALSPWFKIEHGDYIIICLKIGKDMVKSSQAMPLRRCSSRQTGWIILFYLLELSFFISEVGLNLAFQRIQISLVVGVTAGKDTVKQALVLVIQLFVEDLDNDYKIVRQRLVVAVSLQDHDNADA